MSTLAMAIPARDTNRGHLPWRRMAWVVWRQHRVALLGAAVLFTLMAAWLGITGLQLHHAYAAALACRPLGSAVCDSKINTFNGIDDFLANGFLFQVIPPLIGAFVGAPVLARELESGTFRFTWTQGYGRWRWALAKLVALGVVMAAAAGAVSVLTSWYYQPYVSANPTVFQHATSPFAPSLFDLRGLAFAGWTLAAFAIGAFAGMLIRRVVPAIAVTLATYTGVALLTASYLRRHYMAALVTAKVSLPASAWVTGQWWMKDGRVAFTGSGLPPFTVLDRYCSAGIPGGKPSMAFFTTCLAHHGYVFWTAYQPASRFWAFQWIEGGWLLALSAALIATTVWMVRRRPI